MNLDLRTIFTHPSVAELSAVVREARPYTAGIILPLPVQQEYYEASYAQKRLWVLHQLDNAQATYNLSWTYTFEGEQTYHAIKLAFDKLLARHESLRTTFITVEGQPKQKIHPYQGLGPRVSEVNAAHCENPEETVAKLVREEAEMPFDLEQGPLLRLKFIRSGDQSPVVLVLTIHHIVCDGWSAEVLLKEFILLSNDFMAGTSTLLPELPVQYKDFTAWQYQLMVEEETRKHQAYWLDRFSGGVPALELPLFQTRPAVQTVNGATLRRKFSRELTAGLHGMSKQEGVTLFMTLVALVKLLFHRYTGQNEIVVGTPVNGRNHIDLENQVGYYLNALVLYTVVDAADDFQGLLGKVKRTVLEAFDHQMYPIDKLIEELNLPRDTSRAPLFDVLVVLQNFADQELRSEHSRDAISALRIQEVDTSTCVNDLLIEFNEYDGLLQLKLRYNTDLFKAEQMEYLAGHFQTLAHQIIASPGKCISACELLADPERERLLLDFNGAAAVEKGTGTETI
ncbi:MAG: hypothetical protein ICV83_34015, partial [Cytophagales bacterium]|nr:hypothetical protein [Cytophagales bacterium]